MSKSLNCILNLRDLNDSRLFLVQKPNENAFKQSIYELNLFQENRNDVMKKFFNQPINTTLLGFSKVTSFLIDTINSNQNTAGSTITSVTNCNYIGANGSNQSSSTSNYNSVDDGIAKLLDSITADNIHTTNNDGFELVTRVDLGPMPPVERGCFIVKNDITYDKEGRLMDVEKLKKKIFRGVRVLTIIYFKFK